MFSSIETIELLGEVATGVVILGLFFEYFPHFKDRYILPWYERPSVLFHVFGPVMVIAGIALELSFHHVSTGIQNERDVAQQIIIAELRKTAAGLEKEAADSRKQQEQLRAANLALEEKVAPRRLSSAQLTSLTALFAKYPGRTIRVASYELDVDAAMLGLQLLTAANNAKLPAQDRRMSQGALGGMLVGVSITGTDTDLVNALLSLFSSFGLSPTSDEPPPTGGASFGGQSVPFPAKIFIGAKPLAQ